MTKKELVGTSSPEQAVAKAPTKPVTADSALRKYRLTQERIDFLNRGISYLKSPPGAYSDKDEHELSEEYGQYEDVDDIKKELAEVQREAASQREELLKASKEYLAQNNNVTTERFATAESKYNDLKNKAKEAQSELETSRNHAKDYPSSVGLDYIFSVGIKDKQLSPEQITQSLEQAVESAVRTIEMRKGELKNVNALFKELKELKGGFLSRMMNRQKISELQNDHDAIAYSFGSKETDEDCLARLSGWVESSKADLVMAQERLAEHKERIANGKFAGINEQHIAQQTALTKQVEELSAQAAEFKKEFDRLKDFKNLIKKISTELDLPLTEDLDEQKRLLEAEVSSEQ